ncbi:MAG: diguanylate cyclase [Carboxydocellales bacterium]
MFWKQSRLKISYSIIVLFLLSTTLLGVMLLVNNYHFVEQLVKSNAYHDLTQLSDQQLDYLNAWLQERQREVGTLADTTVVRSLNLRKIEGHFQEFYRRSAEFEGLVLVGVNGKTTVDTSGMPGLDVSDQPYFLNGLKGKQFVSDATTSPTSGKPVIILAAPIMANGQIIGVLKGTVYLDRLNKIMTYNNNNQNPDTYLVNKESYMLTESKYRAELIKTGQIKHTAVLNLALRTVGVRQAITGKIITGEFNNYMGSPVLGAYRWLPDRQWVLVAEIHREQVMAAVQEYEKSAVLASAAVIFLGFIPIGVVFAFSITGPITKLRKMVNVISQGNWHQRVQVESFQEIAALAETFNQMADKIEKSEAEIQVKQLELLEKNRLLEKLATTDPLTHVYNRRFILERLPNEMAQASRYGEQLSTIMLDLDHFKRVNDTYGHSIGDQALLEVVEAINLTIRKADIMGRWGGEEFIIICPNTGKAAAVALAERIRQRVEEVDFVTNEGAQIPLTVSIGVAEYYPKNSKSYLSSDDMINRADKALYQAKNSGRNKVVVDME